MQLGDQRAYMYRTYVKKAKKPSGDGKRRRLCMCCCTRAEGGTAAAAPHALRLYTDARELDDHCSLMLMTDTQAAVQENGLRSVHVFGRQDRAPLFRARIGGREPTDESELVDHATVKRVLEVCLSNGQPTDSALRLDDGRKFVIRSLPLWDDHDVLSGALWSIRRVMGSDDVMSLPRHSRAALHYDAATGSFVMNETWMRQRALMGGLLSEDNTKTVLMVSTDHMIDHVVNRDFARALMVPTPPDCPTTFEDMFLPQAAAQMYDAIAYLDVNPKKGTVITGISTPGGGYVFNVSTQMNGVSHVLSGYIVTIHRVDSLSHIVGSMGKIKAT